MQFPIHCSDVFVKTKDAMFWCLSVIHWCDLFWCQSFPVFPINPILNPFPLSAPEAEEVFMFTFSSVGLALSQRNFTFLSIPGRGRRRRRRNSRSSSPRRRRTIRGGVRGAISNTLNLQGIGCFVKKARMQCFGVLVSFIGVIYFGVNPFLCIQFSILSP